MTSPVDTTVKYFNSAMPNAPVLSGTAGSLIALLDACLKDGFNSLSVTIVVASGVATATWSGTHAALVDSVVLIAGVTGGMTGATDLNGEQKVVTKAATTLTFATSAADGTATGAITMKMAPSTWVKSFTGTNKAAYKSSDVTATGMYLRIDDTGTTSARVVGYETMTDVDTGTGPFPTAVQMSGGGYWPKSSNANSTAVAWSLFTDGRIFYLNVLPGYSTNVANQVGSGRCFGDAIPYKTGGDSFACVLNYSIQSSVNNQGDGTITGSHVLQFATPRDYLGLGSAVLASVYPFFQATASVANSGLSGMGGFPSVVDGGLWLCEKFLGVPSTQIPRARMPGFLHSFQSGVWNTFKHNDRTPGSGAFAGRTLVAASGNESSTSFTSASTSSNTGTLFFDVTGPWR